jgi:replicative DNA helicase
MEQNIRTTLAKFASHIEKDIASEYLTERELMIKWPGRFLELRNDFLKEDKPLIFKDLYMETLLAVTNKNEKNVLFESILTGLKDVDNITGGLPLGELIILGARPAMGKTAFTISLLASILQKKNEPVAYFSLENSKESILLKLISHFSEIPAQRLASKVLEPAEVNLISEKTRLLSEANLTIEDSCFTIDDIVAQAHLLVEQVGIKMIIVDYLQLVQTRTRQNREQEISKVCRELKGLARKLNIAVFVNSQLSRAVETRGGDKKPQLSDLRESGAIEQDADKVLFLHRPEYYGLTEDERGYPTKGLAEIIVAKNRAGITDSVTVRFNGALSAFSDFDNIFYAAPENYEAEYFTGIRTGEFNIPGKLIRGSKNNDIEEDHPF